MNLHYPRVGTPASVSRTFAALALLFALTGCQSNGGAPGTGSASSTGSTATGTSTGTTSENPAPPSTGTSSPSAVGERCTGDASKLCLSVHFVTYTDPAGTPTATTAQAATIIHEMNTLWAQCSIGFQIDTYEAVDPTAAGLVYGAASQNQLDQIRQTYSTVTDELLGVTTGPWGTTVNAWTNLPGDGIYGAIMEASIVDYGNGIIYAHEFGHYLGLGHVSDTSNLMNAVIYTTSTALTASQCQTAQDTINSYWSAMIRK